MAASGGESCGREGVSNTRSFFRGPVSGWRHRRFLLPQQGQGSENSIAAQELSSLSSDRRDGELFFSSSIERSSLISKLLLLDFDRSIELFFLSFSFQTARNGNDIYINKRDGEGTVSRGGA